MWRGLSRTAGSTAACRMWRSGVFQTSHSSLRFPSRVRTMMSHLHNWLWKLHRALCGALMQNFDGDLGRVTTKRFKIKRHVFKDSKNQKRFRNKDRKQKGSNKRVKQKGLIFFFKNEGFKQKKVHKKRSNKKRVMNKLAKQQLETQCSQTQVQKHESRAHGQTQSSCHNVKQQTLKRKVQGGNQFFLETIKEA